MAKARAGSPTDHGNHARRFENRESIDRVELAEHVSRKKRRSYFPGPSVPRPFGRERRKKGSIPLAGQQSGCRVLPASSYLKRVPPVGVAWAIHHLVLSQSPCQIPTGNRADSPRWHYRKSLILKGLYRAGGARSAGKVWRGMIRGQIMKIVTTMCPSVSESLKSFQFAHVHLKPLVSTEL